MDFVRDYKKQLQRHQEKLHNQAQGQSFEINSPTIKNPRFPDDNESHLGSTVDRGDGQIMKLHEIGADSMIKHNSLEYAQTPGASLMDSKNEINLVGENKTNNKT